MATKEEIKAKIIAAIGEALEDVGITLEEDLLTVTRVDDNTFKVAMVVECDEDEDEEDDVQPEAEESDFED